MSCCGTLALLYHSAGFRILRLFQAISLVQLGLLFQLPVMALQHTTDWFSTCEACNTMFPDPVLAKCPDTYQHSREVVHLLDLQSCGGVACPGVGPPLGGCGPALLCPQHAADLLLTSSSHPASPSACPCSSHATSEGRLIIQRSLSCSE